MRVLVTGGAGYIGSVATAMLLERGYEVVVLDNLERGHRAAVPEEAELVDCDLRNADATVSAVSRANVEAVLHFAALHLVPESVERPDAYYRTNVIGGINLLDAIKGAGIGKFVFSSTAAVYGVPETSPITEDTPARPINPYGRSKLMVEQILNDYSERFGFAYAAFRYFNVAGAKGKLGEDHRPETHIIPVAVEALTGKRETFTVFGTDYPTEDGTAIRDYVHVVDLAEAHILALEKLDESLGAINLGTRNGFSVNQMVQAVELATDRSLPVAYGPRRAGDPPSLIADSGKARDILGWKPVHSTLDEMIGSHWDWIREHPNGYSG
ncbi:MAG: UDP-glucose 4-epimerase [uncultured Thermomicrobiales bacterium]|uniref:UDP-glucose 4-epimerase n=1 Tax=uncultured Thermomicrobiales bacterium TaxID=1645740 RepID=A0A6J4UWI6_9BACT|nr:MAG: UDP-glucose 4-epimerase [uncultured Thermomicrobiales bacterium]